MADIFLMLLILVVYAICFIALSLRRSPLHAWSTLAAATIFSLSFFHSFPRFISITLWCFFFVYLFFFQINAIRKLVISKKIFNLFRLNIPTLSTTEEEALLAGTSWWDAELFSGKPNWQILADMSPPELSEEERRFLDGPVEKLCEMLDEWHIANENDLPTEVWDFIKSNGFLGMIIPKRYGGLEFSALGHSAVILKLASKSVTAAVTAMVPNSLGPAQLLLRYGTQEQMDNYLPKLAAGSEIPCFALTSPLAGSDASSMDDTGIVCRAEFDGKKEVVGIRLNWEKRYITLAPIATVMGLAFKLYDPEKILGETTDCGITLALVPTDLSGIETGKRHYPLNQAFQNGPTRGRDVFIPIEFVIGGKEGIGHGWRMLMECLADGRSISLPSLSAGVGKLVSRSTGGYARIRKQFKMPIGYFEGIQEALARIAGYTYAIDAVRLMTVHAVDNGERPSVVSAIAKYHCTELMRKVMNDAMDVFGGTAICLGPKNLLGRFYESIPISITVEGANILTRSLIIFGQGVIRCHPYLLKEVKAVQEPNHKKGLDEFDKAFWGHFGFVISNIVRAFILAVTAGNFGAPTPFSGNVDKFARQVTRMSSTLALIADVALLVLGPGIKKKEWLSARLGDVLSQLYIISAAIKRFEDQGRPEEDKALFDWVCRDAIFKAQEKLSSFLDNFPNRLLGKFLKFYLFPNGKQYLPPDDILSSRLALSIIEPGKSRERLTEGIYLPNDPDDPLGRIENAFNKSISVTETENKVRSSLRKLGIKTMNDLELLEKGVAEGILSVDESIPLQEAYNAMLKAIAVDEF